LEADRRLSVRYPFGKTVSFIALGGPRRPLDITVVKARAIDLSNEGMKIQTTERLLTEGAVIQIRIPVTKPRITVPTLGSVTWIKKVKPKAYQVGLSFLL
jgi:hypothetical protein